MEESTRFINWLNTNSNLAQALDLEQPEKPSLWRRYQKSLVIGLVAVTVVCVCVLGVLAFKGSPTPGFAPPVTVPFDTTLATGSEDLLLDEAPLARRSDNEDDPDQIHLALAGEYDFARLL